MKCSKTGCSQEARRNSTRCEVHQLSAGHVLQLKENQSSEWRHRGSTYVTDSAEKLRKKASPTLPEKKPKK
jgi:hypothetical protein